MNNGTIDDKKAIQALYETRKLAVENGDRDSYVDTLDENVRMIPPGIKDVIGKDAYAEFLIPVLQNTKYEIVPLGDIEIEIIGDIALARYDFIINVSEGVDSVKETGVLNQESSNMKYADVLRRQEDGTWKILQHMWNDNC